MTGEKKILNMEPLINSQINITGVSKLLDEKIFKSVDIGEVGQLFWKDILSMKTEKGGLIACEYDISPEFAYHQSILL